MPAVYGSPPRRGRPCTRVHTTLRAPGQTSPLHSLPLARTPRASAALAADRSNSGCAVLRGSIEPRCSGAQLHFRFLGQLLGQFSEDCSHRAHTAICSTPQCDHTPLVHTQLFATCASLFRHCKLPTETAQGKAARPGHKQTQDRGERVGGSLAQNRPTASALQATNVAQRDAAQGKKVGRCFTSFNIRGVLAAHCISTEPRPRYPFT